jgi:hypothetical protein
LDGLVEIIKVISNIYKFSLVSTIFCFIVCGVQVYERSFHWCSNSQFRRILKAVSSSWIIVLPFDWKIARWISLYTNI